MKIIILVLSQNDEGGIYSLFNKAQKETWDLEKVDGVITFYYYGNSNENKIIDKNIFTSVNEELYNCGHKTINAFEQIKSFDFDFLFRTNSSSYVDKQLLKEYLSNKPTTKYYSGVIGNHNGFNFASGSGYVITKDLVLQIIKDKTEINHSLIDDVSFAELLKKKSILPSPNPRYDVIGDELIPENYFHYRLKTENRLCDIINMYKIKMIKYGIYNRK